jgi:tellurite methyltransferase
VQGSHAEQDDPGPGGYDLGYRQCPCFWGTEPARLVRSLADSVDLAGAHVLDLGCGEGKNATFLAKLGCVVEAWDISAAALRNARTAWPDAPVRWLQKDALYISREQRKFDVIIAYGLYHCLTQETIFSTIWDIKRATAKSGYNIAVCYNNRRQINIASAHPGFHPTCLAHTDYINAYATWRIIAASDEDLTERHPTNMIEHVHSMTRILAQNRSPD